MADNNIENDKVRADKVRADSVFRYMSNVPKARIRLMVKLVNRYTDLYMTSMKVLLYDY